MIRSKKKRTDSFIWVSAIAILCSTGLICCEEGSEEEESYLDAEEREQAWGDILASCLSDAAAWLRDCGQEKNDWFQMCLKEAEGNSDFVDFCDDETDIWDAFCQSEYSDWVKESRSLFGRR